MREISFRANSKDIGYLKKVQKYGEYNISGWWLGGTIAFEMVRQLEQENEEGRFFAIIDSKPPIENEQVKIKEFTIESELDWIRNYIKDEEIISELSLKNDLKGLWIDMLGYLKSLSNTEEIINNYYKPKNVVNTQINYFAASYSKQIIAKNWQEFSENDIIIEEIQGAHFTIFKQPNVRLLYEQFEKCFMNVDKNALIETE